MEKQNNQVAIKNNPAIKWVSKPEECLMLLRPSTAVDILNSPNPSLVKIVSELGQDGSIACKAILTLLINEMLDFFNVGKSMDQRQVAATVNLILEDYGQLKPDDFKLCFKRAMKGQYGKVYDRIDGELIFEWLEQFLYDKETEIETFRRNENVQFKKASDFDITTEAVPMPDYVKELTKKEIDFNAPVKPRIISPEQVIMNGYINQFDALYSSRRKDFKGGRFVEKYGKKLNATEYLEYKILQAERVRKYLIAKK